VPDSLQVLSMKTRSWFLRAMAAVAIPAIVGVPFASMYAQSNTFVTGTQYNAAAISSTSTFGNQMTGMQVTWTYADGGGTFSGIWGNLVGDNWGVADAEGFSLGFASFQETFNGSWLLTSGTTKRLASVRINGAPGKTMFDCGWYVTGRCASGLGDAEGTAGSNLGRTFQRNTGYTGAVMGVYSNAIGIGGNAPGGDLFEQLEITFVGGMVANSWYSFYADTDNSDLGQPPPSVVGPVVVTPEPATWAMMLVGMTLMCVVRARRRV
jgi:hypothetical protein